jgi:hypothetical protein
MKGEIEFSMPVFGNLPMQDMKKQMCFDEDDDEICDFQELKARSGGKGKEESSNIGELQKSDGSWDKTSIASLKQHYRLTDKAFDELTAVLNGNLELLLTVLALHWLESEKNAPENVLIIRKAREWIRKECAKSGVTNEQISTVKARL